MAAVSKITSKFTVILEEDTGFSVYCPALPGCVSQGDDRDLALANIREAIESVLDLSGEAASVVETSTIIADELREILDARKQDGLAYSGISLEQVNVSSRVLS